MCAGPAYFAGSTAGYLVGFVFSAADATAVMFSWDFDNDGMIDAEGADMSSASWTYDLPGSYTAKLLVTDANGNVRWDAHDDLGRALHVDVRRVEEVHAGSQRCIDHPACLGLVGAIAERHGSETDLGDLQAGTAEIAIVHRQRPSIALASTFLCTSDEPP